jgi:hypothetical protein
MAGIKETKELVLFVAKLSSSIGHAMEDGKLSFLDMAKMVPLLMKAGDALDGIEQIPAELLDLDAAERQELLDAFNSEFSLPNDKAEAIIEKALGAVAKMHEIYKMFK